VESKHYPAGKIFGYGIRSCYFTSIQWLFLTIVIPQMFAADGMYELKGITEDASASSQNGMGHGWFYLKFLNTSK